MFRRVLTLLFAGAVVLLAGCAGGARRPAAEAMLPPLRLAPAAFGRELALQQRLMFTFGEHRQALEALVEIDAGSVRLAVQALGRTGVILRWDGHALEQRRAEWLPPMVRGERVLDDLQFALWPADAIRAALPTGWTLADSAEGRRLSHAGRTWLQLERDGTGTLQLRNLAEGYALAIDSVELVPDPS